MLNLEQLVDKASDATTMPEVPKQGIPKQWLPHWIRVSIRCVVIPFVFLDLQMQKLASKIIRPPFIQTGACKRRGNCCHYIMIEEGKGLFGRLHHFWNTQVNGFYHRSNQLHIYDGKKVHVMGCRYLKKDGSCSNYRLRPLVCRKWPIIEHFGHPRVLKGCGFQVAPRNFKKPRKENI